MGQRLRVIAAGLAVLPGFADAQVIPQERITNALPKLEAMVDRIIAAKEVPGLSIAIVHQDEIVYLKGFGLRETGKPDPILGADTVFQIASLSKPVSSTVVAALVGGGQDLLEQPDRRPRSSFPPGRALPHEPEVTIRDLFAHRSGLSGTSRRRSRGASAMAERISLRA